MVDGAASDDVSVVLTDVAPDLLATARTKLGGVAVDVGLATADANALPFADARFDAVVCADLFCQLDDPGPFLDEVDRVLRPDGEFRFAQHTTSKGLGRWPEVVVYPVWERTVSGCTIDVDPVPAIRSSDLSIVELDRARDGLLPPWTFVEGVAHASDG